MASEAHRKAVAKWRALHPEKARASAAETRKRCREARLAYTRRWNEKNKALKLAHQTRRHADQLKRTAAWAELEAIKAFYAACPEGFQVDHVIPLRGKNVSGLHVLANLQYLTKFENQSKGNRFGEG